MSASIGRDMLRGDTIRRRADVQSIKSQESETLSERLAMLLMDGFLKVIGLVLYATTLLLWVLGYVPVLGGAAVIVAASTLLAGVLGAVLAVLLVIALVAGWAYLDAERFDEHVTSRLLRFGRRLRYRWGWDDLMAASGVMARDAAPTIRVPRLVFCHLGRHADVLSVQLCPGITEDDLAEASDAIRCEFRGLEVRVLPHRRRGWVSLQIISTDILREASTANAPPGIPDLVALHVGWQDDGQPWLLSLLGRHILIGGATGAGKSSVVASLLTQLAPAIRDGLVRVIGIDPKGGMEFGLYAQLFHLFACESEYDLVLALEAAADLMDDRTRALRSITRQHTPSREMPFYLVLIDEIASLTAYVSDRALKERARQALGRLLTKGRAPGVSVLGCVQDPRKEVIDLRGLFSTRIGLRLTEKKEVDMLLGDGARDRGAKCDRVAMTTPGVGYVLEDGSTTVTKVRAAWVTDDHLRWLATTYPSPTHDDVTRLRVVPEDKPRRPRPTKNTKSTDEVS